MNAKLKLTLSVAVLATSLLGSTVTYAAASGNVGVTNNYIWRGVTQSADDTAVSGGLDYDFGNGFSMGTWASSLGTGGGYELDLYGGYGGKIGATDYSVGLTHYRYPVGTPDAYFTEVNGSLGFGIASFNVAYTFNSDDNNTPEFSKGDIYYSLGASTEIKPGLSLGGLVGKYDFDDAAGDDYTHVQVNLSKGDFTFAVDKTSGLAGNNDARVSVAWSHALDL